MAKWLIEDFMPETRFADLAHAVRRAGHEAEITRYEPFESGLYRQFRDDDRSVVVQASVNLTHQLARQKPLWNIWWSDAFDFHRYQTHWAEWALNRRHDIMTLSSLAERRREIVDRYGSLVFLRPDGNDKVFSGITIALGSADWLSNPYWRFAVQETPPDSLIVVAPVREIEHEWRFVVLEGRVLTGCQYRKDQQSVRLSVVEPGAAEIANIVAHHPWQPAATYVVDICFAEGRYWLLEIGCLNCAGLYALDLDVLAREISGFVDRAPKADGRPPDL